MPERLTEEEMLALSGSALTKIDGKGPRGTSMVTFQEIEAMAALIDCMGAGHACLRAFDAAKLTLTGDQS
jgi:hypothetical protein